MSGDQRVFERAMNLGHSAAWDQHWEEAAGHYEIALEEFPNHPMAITSLGLALFELQEFTRALGCYEHAAQVIPDDPMPVEKMARIHEKLTNVKEAVKYSVDAAELHLKARNADKAIENWLRALYLQPENLPVRARLAMVYERMGRKRDAVTHYLSAAALLQRMGQRGKAIQVAQFALQLVPNSDEARQTLNLLNNNMRLPVPDRPQISDTSPVRVTAPVRVLDAPKEKQLDPLAEARQKAMVDLAGLLFDQAEESPTDESRGPGEQGGRKGLAALARGTGSLSAEQANRTRILLHLGQAIESQTNGQDAQAAEELERAMDAGLNHPSANFDLGLLRAERSGQRAMRYLQKSVKHPDYALASYVLMAQVYQREENFAEAAAAYLQALRLADMNTVSEGECEVLSQLYEPIIEAQANEKDQQQLQTLCQNLAGQIVRPDWRSYLLAARSQMGPSDSGAPLPLAEMLLQSNSSQVVEALSRIRGFMEKRQYRAAMDEAFNSLQLAPTYLPIHIQIGDILLREGQTQEAVAKFMTVAELYSLRGEAAQAIHLLSRVVSMAPMEMKVRGRLIDLLAAQERFDEALQHYWDLANMYYHLSELSLARQTYTNALRLAQQARSDNSWSVQILYKIADIDIQCLEWRQALRIFEQIRTLEPEDENARVMLVDLNLRLGHDASAYGEADSYTALLEQSGRRNAAIQFLEKIINDHPDKLELLKRLADLHIRNGQVPQAVSYLDKIADGLLSAGNRDGAMAMLRAIIALKPDNISEYQTALMQLKAGSM